MKQTKRKKRLRMAGRGVLFLLGVVTLIVIPIADKVRRGFYKPPDKSVWLKIEGNFADHPTEEPDYGMPEETPERIILSDETDIGEDEPQKAGFSLGASVRLPDKCVMLQEESSAVHNGCMLQLDSKHSYSGNEGGMTSTVHSRGGYGVHGSELPLMPYALEALDRMAQGYVSATGQHDLLLYSTTEAGGIYDRTLPDMETGYCIDLATEDEEGRIQPYYSRGIWLEENAYRYGFVFSYTEEDADVTGIDSAPYHLRYVGRAHAGLMHELALPLSAYLEKLHTHSTDDPLYYEDGSHTYTVYYVPKSFGSTDVPVPRNGKYEISGDNENGFIVAAEGHIE